MPISFVESLSQRFTSPRFSQHWQTLLGSPVQPPRPDRKRVRFLRSRQVMFYTLTVAAMVGVYGIPSYNEPHLSIGSRAPETLVAPVSATIEDPIATERLRRQARDQTIPVWQADPQANQTMRQDLERWLRSAEAWRQQAGVLPLVSTELLTTPVQAYLRRLTDVGWQDFLSGTGDPQHQLGQTAREQWQRLTQSSSFERVVEVLRQARQGYTVAVEAMEGAGIPADPHLLDLTEAQWQRLRRVALRAQERLIMGGISPGLPVSLKRQGVQAQLNDLQPTDAFLDSLHPLLLFWLEQSIQPNLIVDPVQTRLRSEAAVGQIPPLLVTFAPGDVIVAKNEEITPELFLILDYFHLTQRRINFHNLFTLTLLLAGSLAAFRLIYPCLGLSLRNRDRLLLLLLTLTVPALAIPFGVALSSLPAMALLVSNYYGRRLGLCW